MCKTVKFVYIYLVHVETQLPTQSCCDAKHMIALLVPLGIASRPLTLSRQRRLYLHPANNRGSIFLPPLACGFTLPQGDSRWRSPMLRLEFRAFPAKHPLFSALRTYVFGRSLFSSSDTDMLLFHLMPSLRFFCFRTLGICPSLSFRIAV